MKFCPKHLLNLFFNYSFIEILMLMQNPYLMHDVIYLRISLSLHRDNFLQKNLYPNAPELYTDFI